ncbi:MAG: divalent-cation tolerance protein CutA [Thermodesulfovibrionales bacterium]
MGNMVVFVTAPDAGEAAAMARALVEERLAACVNIVGGVRSIYSWEGKVEDGSEALMVIKTREALFEALAKRVAELHSYEVPEVIALPITKGAEKYLRWMEEVTGP